MAAITQDKHTDFQWSASDLILSILFGVAATVGLWFGAGLLLMLFLL
ncbi:MAG: hypothetical protein JSW69_00100 [Deltaproteobacteria bacterium]|jgi:hypothetical protein|nr:MAG: hypothetical protein JSW69_00100 [Deltaproteobacteria bacterium]